MSIAVLNTDATRSPISEDRLAALVDIQRAALRDEGAPTRANRLALLRTLDAHLVRHTSEILKAIESDFVSRSIVETWLYDLRPVRRMLRQARRRLRAAAGVSRVFGAAAANRIDDGHGIGVTGFVPTWHFPFAQALVPVVSAIASGHRVLLALPHPGLVFCPPAEHREPMSGLAIPFSMWQCAGHGDAAGPGFVR